MLDNGPIKPKPRLDSVMNALMTDYPESTTLRLMREDPHRPLGDFINMHRTSTIWLLIDENPDSGLVELIEEDIFSDIVYQIEKNPDLVNHISDITQDMKTEVRAASSSMTTHINNLGDGVFKILETPPQFIFEEEYAKNFHHFFAGRDVTEDERIQIMNSWLQITHSASSPVLIVDEDGKGLFRHPGVMGVFDILGNYASWPEFSKKGKEQSEIMPGMKEAYQKHVIEGFTETLEATKFDYNLGAIIELERIKQYFDDKIGFEDPERVDLFELYGVKPFVKPGSEEVEEETEGDDVGDVPTEPTPTVKEDVPDTDWSDIYK